MKKLKQKIKKKPLLIGIVVFYFLFVISSICLIYSTLKISNIENFIRYLLATFMILLIIFNGIQSYKIILKSKNFFMVIFFIFLLLVFIGESYACGIINELYNSINNIYKNTYTYSTSFVVMTTNDINDINDINDMKIGMISDDSSIDEYELAKEILDENNLNSSNEIIEYDTVAEVIQSLYDEDIDVALVTSTYVSMLINTDDYENISTETNIIYTKTKIIEKDDDNSSKSIDQPFTILLMGIDSTVDDISEVTAFNADSLILITFNPNTYNATILSIPRDTYSSISCLTNKKSKITHSGWYGESCVVRSVEELTDIDIDYYVKINFKGVVNLVDALG
ncbi:MAG TPA: LCP family protein, partial [Bacilli bacterium]|nr:LCP family protein [Bacilli bacterium]